jgi:hypothetical protein
VASDQQLDVSAEMVTNQLVPTAPVEQPLFHRGGSVSTEDQPGRYSSLSPSTTGCLAAQRAGQ